MSGPPPKALPSVLGLPPVPFKKLYSFATTSDIAKVVCACVCGAAGGAILPLFSLVFGSALNSINDPTANLVSSISTLALYFLLIAIGASILTFAESYLMISATESQILRMRSAYCKNLLRLDATWYDTHRVGECVSRLSEASISVGTGMEKVASITRYTATLITGISIGFAISWKLTLVIMACAPLFVGALVVLIITAISSEKQERASYARAGDVATEVFSLFRTVSAFSGEAHEGRRYDTFLALAEKAGIRKGLGIGGAVGTMLFTFYSMYGVSTYSGATFILESRAANPQCRFVPTLEGCYSGGTVVTTFVAVLLGALSFGQIGPLFGQLSAARAAAADLYGVIDAVPGVDVEDEKGYRGGEEGGTGTGAGPVTELTPPPPKGHSIEFKGVKFAYPSRPDTVVLQDFSLTIPAGQCIGVVGTSGSGKSTLCALIMRAYDVDAGEVLVGGVNVKQWHLPSLRASLGYVSQDPVLFATSIRENIALGSGVQAVVAGGKVEGGGLDGGEDAAIIAAAQASNAHTFISALPQGYATPAGTSTSQTQLSGGQRQRVCIARALVRSPKALLLDEATSALDTHSERHVQDALDALAASSGKTMVVVAHRLSTLQNVNRIVVLTPGGVIVEDGTPKELQEKGPGGVYSGMLAAQRVTEEVGVEGSPSPSSTTTSTSTAITTTPTSVSTPSPEPGIPPSASADAAAAAGGKGAVEEVSSKDNFPGAPSKGAQLPKESLSSRIWAIQLEDWPMLILGIVGASASGCSQPITALIYGGMISAYYNPDDAALREQSLQYLGWFFLLAGGVLLGVLCRVSVWTYLGERLTRKLRLACFTAVTQQPGAFFDRPENAVGRLTTRLATDCALVKGAAGESLGSTLEGFAAVVAALAIAFNASWRLALVLLVAFPLLVIGGVFEFRSVAQISKGGNKELENAGELLSEAITAVRTVQAYGLQPTTYASFTGALVGPYAQGIRRAVVTGLGGGFQRFILLATYSLAFYSGAQFIAQGWLTFPSLINVFLAITLAAEAVGRISSQAPDTAKAESAAAACFALIDEGLLSPINPLALPEGAAGSAGILWPPSTPPGTLLDIVFEKVHFAYPSRPGTPVLTDFSTRIPGGQFVGVCGASGSGKSTLVALLLRVYDVTGGAVRVGGVDVRLWNVGALRAYFGLVSQEPALFADSIGYNIGYGVASQDKPDPGQGVQPKETGDNTATTGAGTGAGGAADASSAKAKAGEVAVAVKESDEAAAVAATAAAAAAAIDAKVVYPPPPPEVVTAAQVANAATFISQFPAGYATFCGARGSQLSGGQKQRVAIARSLLRSPKCLLLDEATAALDSTSEAVVQAALDAVIRDGARVRSTLCIAHRLSTLAQADRILVIEKGAVVEDGNHSDLMALNGKYKRLALAQQSGMTT